MGGAGGSGRGKIQVTSRPNKTEASTEGEEAVKLGEAEGFVRCGTEFPYHFSGNLKAGL